MLTNNEITALNLSPTKKDFVQIWNELLDVAGRLSERWDPTSTNESDPGIVILKALTGIADKLNYNIDKNILEAFMPTAAQEDSMRKLCDMLGYNVKYYRSAETTVDVKYHNSDPSASDPDAIKAGLLIPKFTVITNSDQDINYFTTESVYISTTNPSVPIKCMEGQIVKCESTTDNYVITASQISYNNRFYLPEHQIAENGIFIYNVVANSEDGDVWNKVDNLNIQTRKSRVFKFGYDSYEGRPYVEFPGDYSELINDGLYIYYTRTSGADGNVSARTLTQLELPNSAGWDSVSAENFSAENAFSATTGSNTETIGQAYNNFKKTIGTFETLVTCRDYMNKIYSMTDDATSKYLVSNALVTDIRTDINRAVTICSCDDAGIFYKATPLSASSTTISSSASSAISVADGAKTVTNTIINTVENHDAINHFDLVLYPYKSYTQIKSNVRDIQSVYDKSFEYTQEATTIKSKLDQSDVKTIAHNIVLPREHDIISINNYLRLNAIIGTTSKVTIEEGELLIDKIKIALANAFNMRELDFGEEIPFDSIISVIENADARISIVSLAEPALYTTFSVYEGTNAGTAVIKEYAVASDWLTEAYANESNRFEYSSVDSTTGENKYTHTFDTSEAKKIYNRLAVRNVLAGRVPLFKYNTTFKTGFSDGVYRVTDVVPRSEVPTELAVPDVDNPFTVYTKDDIVYTGQLTVNNGTENNTENGAENHGEDDDVSGSTTEGQPTTLPSGEPVITYTKTYTPEEYMNGLVAKNIDDDTNYTELEAKCEISVDKGIDGKPTTFISDVSLADGEFVKFRAPNFITNKTYPAYVNYHLKLNRPSNQADKEAVAAKAITLYTLLADKTSLGESWRDNLFAYFKSSKNKKKFTLTQTVYGRVDDTEPKSSGITIKLDNNDIASAETTAEILDKSGFIHMVSGKANIASADKSVKLDHDIAIPEIYLHSDYLTISSTKPNRTTEYILNDGIFDNIKVITDMHLNDINVNILPEKDWTISYDFEYVPFDITSLSEWVSFVKSSASLLGFSPVAEQGTVLWRIYQGSYNLGKYVLSDSSKLLTFTSGHFGLLESNRLESIYIVEDLGRDAVLDHVPNDEEYELRYGEYLYIEYTPSTTTEDGTAQKQESIKEVLGAGTIIKPSGFDGDGVLSSEALLSQGKTAHKKVLFGTQDGASSTIEIDMYSLGANEQIALRELSKVTLDYSKLSNSPTLYVYKNFNGCDELEKAEYDSVGKRKNNSYTLKDGEYIFYTDENKSEFAYYTSGTKVTLEGKSNIVIPKRDFVDISTIFDSGIQEIPWTKLTINKTDAITFQEFQYITLGPNDVLKSLLLYDASEGKLTSKWQKCSDAAYEVYGTDEVTPLKPINLAGTSGNGWEVCSILELNVSPSRSQTLRTTDKVQTSVDIYKTPASNIGERVLASTIKAKDADHPISFKSNVSCVSSNGKINIGDMYAKADNVKSLEIKVMSEQLPAVVKTEPGKLTPISNNSVADIATYSTSTIKTLSNKSYDETFTRVSLADIARSTSDDSYDNALKLSVSVLPNTYGIFSIYLKYDEDTAGLTVADIAAGASPAETWIELLPGNPDSTIELLNDQTNKYSDGKLKLREGINCVRVNKTCDLYIKTSYTVDNSDNEDTYRDNITSAICFDELRLVDCQPIEYIENGEKKLQNTQGLNLAQIGYLDTAEVDPLNSFDLQIRRNIRKDYTDNALNALEERRQSENLKISEAELSLQEDKSKLQALVSFVNTAKTELDTLLTNTEEQIINELFEKYVELCVDLEQEKDLMEALIADKNVVELEKKLNSLLADLDSGDSIKQELLAKLDALDIAASSRASMFTAENLSKGAILDDFESVASSDDTQLISDLKLFSLQAVNEEYSTKLEKLTEAISAISDDNAKNTLLAILDDINVSKHEKLVSQIHELLNAKQDAIMSMLDTVKTLADGSLDSDSGKYRVDYVSLRVALTSLREYIVGADIAEILSRLDMISDSAMENSDKYSELISITDELNKLLNPEGEAVVGNYAAIVADVNSILDAAKKKIDSSSTAQDSSIITSVDLLYTKINSIYIKQLKSLLLDLQSVLSEIEDNYLDAIKTLDDNTEVQAILSNIESYKNARLAQISSIDTFGSTPINDAYLSSLPYGTLSVVSVWPAYMKRSYIIGLASLYRDIRIAINIPESDSELELDNNFYAGKNTRFVLTSVANVSDYYQLFDKTKTLANVYAQGTKRVDLVNALSALITPSVKLKESLEIISNDSDEYAERNSVLKQLIRSWLDATSITEKQHSLSELATELSSVISIDTILVDICANLLCPSILLFKTGIISDVEDEFYDRLRSYISEQEVILLDAPSGSASKILGNMYDYMDNAYSVLESLLVAVEAKDINKFEYLASISPAEESYTLLSSYYLDNLVDIKTSLDIKDQIDAINSSKLMKLLQKDLVVAWQDRLDWKDSNKNDQISYNWLDSNGEYYQKFTNYLNIEEPAKWVAYPNNGTPTSQMNWLKANGQWTSSLDDKGVWKTHSGLVVNIDAKREYNGSMWLDSENNEIVIRDSHGWLNASGGHFVITDKELEEILTNESGDGLLDKVEALGQLNCMSDEAKTAHSVLWLETQLLNEIKELDRNGEFYYNVPIETSVAVDFHESDSKLNTLMNPAVNYDINNINNNFVISKLDVNYLTSGLQIARSSKIN